ncbi:RNA 2',3'-cyclic phosphodiesterase [Prosthecochloris sp. SCSIO W1101]|uniref:RNA 2',3'-cyclic phosphodiesterase n=1 Tax=Prosthecochloris sp. SCSIO W1101 TaxID=2992242 RepID=UPI00223DFCE3|nr:RNA 2',3'-cyclic phosphodiesterase [Prosthecochloris sp. SCSIO W1101]UZJ40777.1 RNA 2',3'-cyclic phosphodiesterase [Prosthecochloris sp. SCSIO W1101]
MKKRVFIAMPAEEVLRSKASSFREAHRNLPVRWVPPENLHVTLVPPWYCDDVEGIFGKLHDLLDTVKAFDVCFGTISVGPTLKKPRLIWASGGVHDGLGKLQEKLSCLVEPRFDKAEKAFLLHVTLARVEKNRKICLVPEVIDWKATFHSVRLYESILRPSGAEYRVLCEVELGAE